MPFSPTDLPVVRVAATAMARALAAADAARPAEAIGVLGGRRTDHRLHVTEFLPLAAAGDARRYSADAAAFATAAAQLAAGGTELLGFLHSHPDASPHLSRDDLRLAWNGMLQLVLGGTFRRSQRKAFVVHDGVAHPAELRIDDTETDA